MKINQTCQLAPVIRVRWLTIACFEIQIGNHTVIIDPCLQDAPAVNFGPEVFEKADLLLLSHSHWDHITDMKAVMDRFQCPMLCGELSAMAMLQLMNCNPHYVYPMSSGTELDFGFVKVKALFGRHTNQHKTLEELTRNSKENPVINSPEMELCALYGHMEYRNYLITVPGGLKILFWGSNGTIELINSIKDLHPDVGLIQFTGHEITEIANLVKESGVKVMIPHHMDLHKTEDYYLPRIAALEDELQKIAPNCLVVVPEHKKWYNIGIYVSA